MFCFSDEGGQACGYVLFNEFQLLTLFTAKQQDNQLDIVASMHFKGSPY
jgi:hypothetical protein